MKLKKINLGKLNISSLSERELNNVFGGVLPTTTVSTGSGNGGTHSKTGADQDIVGDSDDDVMEEIIIL